MAIVTTAEGISIHALLAESDRYHPVFDRRFLHFYPRSPCGERRAPSANGAGPLNFYPRSPCGERPYAFSIPAACLLFLSTLSLRRATGQCSAPLFIPPYFYPRSPCGERPILIGILQFAIKFLSTLSLRRATLCIGHRFARGIFLSTLSLRRATVSLPASRALSLYFYPRSPCGERPHRPGGQPCGKGISIHALLAESDPSPVPAGTGSLDFYPRSPCGERLAGTAYGGTLGAFLSTLSLRRATGDGLAVVDVLPISIHALLAESDLKTCN